MKDYSFKELADKFINFDDPMEAVVLEILEDKPISRVAKEYGLPYNDVVDAFVEKVRKAFVELADGPSADGRLTIDEIKKFLSK